MQAIHPGYGQMRVSAYSARRPSKAVAQRRRLAVLFCIVSLSFLAWAGLRQLADTSGGGPLTAVGRSVGTVSRSGNLPAQLIGRSEAIVQAGDTLWSIARRVQPTGDVRPLVSTLIDAYGGRPLHVGETLEIP